MPAFNPDDFRDRFHELTAQHDKQQGLLQPLRDKLDALVAGDTKLSVKAARAEEDELRRKIAAAQDKLYPIEQERAMLARALGGNTGKA